MYNYNKDQKNNQFSLSKEQYKKLILAKQLYNKLPSILKVAKNKNSLKTGKIKIEKKDIKTLLENEYLYFNMYTCNFLIIDIDNKQTGIYKMIELLDDNFIQQPSWIIETTKGYQIGFELEKPFYLVKDKMSESDKQALKYAKYVLHKINLLLGGDPAAERIQGFFRNPCGQPTKRKLIFTQNKFNLSDFDIYMPGIDKIVSRKTDNEFHKEAEIVKSLAYEVAIRGNLNILNSVKPGYRNSFIWYVGMYIARTDFNKLNERLNFYNNNLPEPLGEKEMENIKNSIKKYTRQKQNFVSMGAYKDWTPELKRIYNLEYKRKKGIIKKSREQIKEENKNKVLQAIYKLKAENQKVSIRKIAELTKLNKNTVNKYTKELKEDPRFSSLF